MHTTGERYTRAFHLKYTGDSWKQELDKRRLLSRRRVRRSNGSVSPKECRLGLGSGKGTSVKYFTVQMMISVSKKKRKTVQMMKEWSQREGRDERDSLLSMNPWSKLWALSACSGVPDIRTTFSMTPGLSSASVTDAPDICYQQSLESENGVDLSYPSLVCFKDSGYTAPRLFGQACFQPSCRGLQLHSGVWQLLMCF